MRLRRDPGLLLAIIAVVLAFALYAPTLGRGLVNYDDPWLIRDNTIVNHPSWSSLSAIVFDTSVDTRAVLGAEYLPVRDVSVMLDVALWGNWYGGFHLTNVLLYLIAIALWFKALEQLGIDRTVAGLAVLLWAVHPTHAETVAWLAERKGLLAIVFAGVCARGYAQFRQGKSPAWLAVAIVAAPLAVWSKALAAFAIAALPILDALLPARRRSWRRSLFAVALIGIATGLAFIPVLIVATHMGVVDAQPDQAGRFATVFGVFGMYLRLAAIATPNAVIYPITTDGPSTLDIVLGAVGVLAALAVLLVPARGRWQPSAVVRVGIVLWLAGWFPVSRLVLPVRVVVAADRYLLFPTLGLAVALAAGICAIPRVRLRALLGAAIAIACAARSLDAQANWRDARSLWQRAVEVSPRSDDAWSNYIEALSEQGDPDAAARAVDAGLAHVNSPRLLLHKALLLVRTDPAEARVWMRRAAEGGEPRAMSNLALMLLDTGELAEAATWAQKAIAIMPRYANAYRALGKIELARHDPEAARAAFARAVEIEPDALTNRFNLALALLALNRVAEARPLLEACLADPQLAPRARALLDQHR